MQQHQQQHQHPRRILERTGFNLDGFDPRQFRERIRIPRECLEYLIDRLGPILERPTHRSQAFTPSQLLIMYLRFLGTNCQFFNMQDIFGIDRRTVSQVVTEVTEAILTIEDELIRFPSPEKCLEVAAKFYGIAKMPGVIGCVDGTHVTIQNVPKDVESGFVNRHHNHSYNVAVVVGFNYEIYFTNVNHPGSWHDSRILKDSRIWTAFEEEKKRPFDGAIILGDSAYPLTDWLIPPFRGDHDGKSQIGKFNKSHTKTRSTVERAIGVIKKRFYVLKEGFRIHSLDKISKIIKVCVILHNICVKFGDHGKNLRYHPDVIKRLGYNPDDYEDDDDEEEEEELTEDDNVADFDRCQYILNKYFN